MASPYLTKGLREKKLLNHLHAHLTPTPDLDRGFYTVTQPLRVYKKVQGPRHQHAIATLTLLADTLVYTAALTDPAWVRYGKFGRASRAFVERVADKESDAELACGISLFYRPERHYHPGELVLPHHFNKSPTLMLGGIHFAFNAYDAYTL